MKLSDTQLTILSAASQREDRAVVLPERLSGGAADKVVNSLAGKGLVEAVTASAGMPVWRESEDGRHLALRITDAGLSAIGIEPKPQLDTETDPGPTEAGESDRAPKKKAARRRTAKAGDAPQATAPAREEKTGGEEDGEALGVTQPRTGTKLERFVELMRRPEGVSIQEAAEALEWQAHSVRGAVAGALKKEFGLTISSEKVEGRGTVYRIAD